MSANRYKTNDIIWICLAPLFYSAMNISANLTAAHLSVWQISVGRFGFGLVVLPVLVRLLGLKLWGQKRILLTLRGLSGTAAFLCLVAAFQRIPLSVAMVLFYLYPTFTAILSPWITGEPTSAGAWPFICSAFFGTCLILWPFGAPLALNSGHLFGIASSLLAAVTLLLVRRLGRENNIYTLFFYMCLTGTLMGAAPPVIRDLPILPATPAGWIGVACVAVFSIGAQLTLNQALVRIPAPQVSVMMTAEVALAACVGVIFLGEPLTWNFVAGTLLIFASGIGLNLMPLRQRIDHVRGR